MLRPILRYGDSSLLIPSTDLAVVTDATRDLVRDMIDTMYAARGIGLAAPQIGVNQRIFVVDVSGGHRSAELRAFINPVVVESAGMQLEEEGCLSVPGFEATVARPARLVVRGLDQQGAWQTMEGTGLLARAFQHELDHLDGRLFVDRLHGLNRHLIVRKIRKLARAGRW